MKNGLSESTIKLVPGICGKLPCSSFCCLAAGPEGLRPAAGSQYLQELEYNVYTSYIVYFSP